MDHHWNIALVILSLLTFVLAVTTLVVMACIKRENKRFYKRFASKTSSSEQEDVDIELQTLMLKLSGCRDIRNKQNIRFYIELSHLLKVAILVLNCSTILIKWNTN